DSLENKVDSLENKVDSLENKVDSLENKVDSLENKVDNLEKGQQELKYKLDIVYQQTACLTEFRTEMLETQKSIKEILIDQEIAIRILKRRAV
ncbi:MAG: hypothetical protein PWQ67_1134, partial [Clostridia bacterium]|nr:hypothetical protein [Clostridia bacterium]